MYEASLHPKPVLCTNIDIWMVNKLQMRYKDNPDVGALNKVTALARHCKDIPLFTAETTSIVPSKGRITGEE